MATKGSNCGRDGIMRRQGHRGWLLENMRLEQYIRITPQRLPHCRAKLEGFPQKMHWPLFNDWSGAQQFIDAVMARDCDALDAYRAKYPAVDFGIDAWLEETRRIVGKHRTILRTLVASRPLKHGFRVDLERVTDTLAGTCAVVALIRRGQETISEVTLRRVATVAPRQTASPATTGRDTHATDRTETATANA